MISRLEFPYLQSLVINDAYAVKNLTVPVFGEGEQFKHLILTGRNGSGKTTVLRGLIEVIANDATGGDLASKLVSSLAFLSRAPNPPANWQVLIDRLGKVSPSFYYMNGTPYNGLADVRQQSIVAFFEAYRRAQVQDVSTVTQDSELETQVRQFPSKSAALFKQYLINKKVAQVFDEMEGKSEAAQQQELFFTKLEGTLTTLFADDNLKLEFVRESFEFYINLSDGRRFTFNQLSAGFSAFFSILTELLIQTDLLRKQANDYTYDPCGFVLIDEPETHLHLEMQYQILPLLTGLFPNLQFIVATHSPAVASSIKNATVFDLSTGQATGDQAAGSSYSELMQTHFGVENEYSEVADAIIKRINELAQWPDKAEARQQLQALLVSEGRYMSPALRLEVEAQLIGLEVED